MIPNIPPLSAPPQPGTLTYSTDELKLAREFTRQTYLATTGAQAAPYDPSRPTKRWLDPSQAGKTGNVTYQTIIGGELTPSDITLSCEDAAAVNLEGGYQYPAYVPPPNTTPAVQGLPGTTPIEINPGYICELADAQELAHEMGLGVPMDMAEQQWPYPVQWGTETRRAWGDPAVGLYAPLIAVRNAGGVGAPGSWAIANGGAAWTPAPQPAWGTFKVEPVPMRGLFANEKLIANTAMMGIGTLVQRIDLIPQAITLGQPAAPSALTPQEAAQLQTIFDWVQRHP